MTNSIFLTIVPALFFFVRSVRGRGCCQVQERGRVSKDSGGSSGEAEKGLSVFDPSPCDWFRVTLRWICLSAFLRREKEARAVPLIGEALNTLNRVICGPCSNCPANATNRNQQQSGTILDASPSMSLMLGNSVTSMKTHQFRNDLAIFYGESQLRRVEDKHLTSQKSQCASGMPC